MHIDRFLCHSIELKFAEDGGEAMTFAGYGAVFDNRDSYGDVIVKGAFKDTLREAKKTGQWPAMLLQHGLGLTTQDMMPIGVWTRLEEDDKGLLVEGKLADTPRGREVYTLMKMTPRPAIDGLSIGYRAKEFVVGTKPEEPRRQLKKVELLEISPVTFPANPESRVRSVKAAQMTEREIERVLMQDAQFTRSEARALMRGGVKGLIAMQDAGEAGDPELAAALQRLKSTIAA